MPTCPRCGNALSASARFCPRRGESRGAAPETPSRHPATAGIPWAGIMFVLGILFAPAAVFAGLYWHSNALLIAGLVAAAVMLMVVLLGMMF